MKSFSNTFKPAILFGTPTLDQLSNQIFVKENKEAFDKNNHQLTYSNLPYDTIPDVPDAMSVYTLETSKLGVRPNIRCVSVRGKKEYTHSYLFEAETNDRGLAVIMLKENNADNQIYCNVRILPYSTLTQVLVNTSGEQMEINIPKSNIVKLNVTLKPSTTGEVLYRTHKTEVDLQNTSEAEADQIRQNLELNGAKYVAYYASMITTPQANPNEGKTGLSQAYSLALGDPADFIKKLLLFLSMASTLTALSIASVRYGQYRNDLNNDVAPENVRAFTPGWTFAIAFFAALGGLLRGGAGLIGAFQGGRNNNNNDNNQH